MDVEVLPDGSLLVSDEQNGVIYRISYNAHTPSNNNTKDEGSTVEVVTILLLTVITLGLLRIVQQKGGVSLFRHRRDASNHPEQQSLVNG